MLFANAKEEDRLCQVLKAYFEEWGGKNIVVSVPTHWSEYSTSTLGAVRLRFETDNSIVISVYNNDERVLRYAVYFAEEEAIQSGHEHQRMQLQEGQSLEFCLSEFALRYLKEHDRHGKKVLVSKLLAREIEKPQNKLLLERFEQKYGQAAPDEIAYWIIEHLLATGHVAGPGHELFLTDRHEFGRHSIILQQSQFPDV